MSQLNEFGQKIGPKVPNWTPRPLPKHKTIVGKYCTLVRPDPEAHALDIFEAHSGRPQDFTYMLSGAYQTVEDARKHLEAKAQPGDPCHFAVLDNATGKAVGTLSYLRISPSNGSIEVGHVTFSDKMKRSFLSTEAQFLMMVEAFDVLGYRRYEWKCHSFNEPSKAAAKRLGFQFEGVFRNHLVLADGTSRDTAWFSITDLEWPAIKLMLEKYLSDENNDHGVQKRSLREFA